MILVPKSEKVERKTLKVALRVFPFHQACVDPCSIRSISEKDRKLKLGKGFKACVHIYLHVGSRWQALPTLGQHHHISEISSRKLHPTGPSQTRKIWKSSKGKKYFLWPGMTRSTTCQVSTNRKGSRARRQIMAKIIVWFTPTVNFSKFKVGKNWATHDHLVPLVISMVVSTQPLVTSSQCS